MTHITVNPIEKLVEVCSLNHRQCFFYYGELYYKLCLSAKQTYTALCLNTGVCHVFADVTKVQPMDVTMEASLPK